MLEKHCSLWERETGRQAGRQTTGATEAQSVGETYLART